MTTRRRLEAFLAHERANFTIAFALLIAPALVAAGSMMDYARAAGARQMLQAIADSAVLSTNDYTINSAALVQAKAAVTAQAQVSANPAIKNLTVTSTLSADGRSTSVTLTASVTNAMMGIFGKASTAISATAEMQRGSDGSLEVALVLDNTGSMSQNSKLQTAKASALSLLDAVFAANGNRARVALVPFARYVNVGTGNRGAPWLSGSTDYSATTQSCSTRYGTTTCSDVTTTYTWSGCVGSRVGANTLDDNTSPYPAMMNTTCTAPLVPLTTEVDTVRTAVNAMVATGNTYIPAGLMWGWNVLSPGNPFTEATAYDPANRKPRKVLVLMTDGENTASMLSNGSHAGSSRTDADTATASLCSNIKAQKIEVFAIAFMVTDTAAKSMLQTCASDANHYFDAADSTAYTNAFKKIAFALQMPLLSK